MWPKKCIPERKTRPANSKDARREHAIPHRSKTLRIFGDCYRRCKVRWCIGGRRCSSAHHWRGCGHFRWLHMHGDSGTVSIASWMGSNWSGKDLGNDWQTCLYACRLRLATFDTSRRWRRLPSHPACKFSRCFVLARLPPKHKAHVFTCTHSICLPRLFFLRFTMLYHGVAMIYKSSRTEELVNQSAAAISAIKAMRTSGGSPILRSV